MSLHHEAAAAVCANIDEGEPCAILCKACSRQAAAVIALCQRQPMGDPDAEKIVAYFEELWPERVAEARRMIFWRAE